MVLRAGRGWGPGVPLQWDLSSVGVPRLLPLICPLGRGGLLVIVAFWAVRGCGYLGVPIWVFPSWGDPCLIHSLVCYSLNLNSFYV